MRNPLARRTAAVHPALTLLSKSSDCPDRCPVCSSRCTGGPTRFLGHHICVSALHQWGADR